MKRINSASRTYLPRPPPSCRPIFDSAAMSTRAYGRFGSFFKTTLQPGKLLELRYRILILRESKDQPLTVAELQRLYDDFAEPLLASSNGAR